MKYLDGLRMDLLRLERLNRGDDLECPIPPDTERRDVAELRRRLERPPRRPESESG